MTQEHPALDALVVARDGQGEDRTREHLDVCSVCRLRLSSYDEFLSCGPADAEAEARLRASIAAMVGARRARREPRWRLGIAAAAMAAAAVAAFMVFRPQEPPPVHLRQSNGPSWVELQLDVAAVAGGGVDLSWRGMEAADGYGLTLFGAELTPLAQLPPQRGTELRLYRGFAGLSSLPDSFFVRVSALRDSVEIGRSPLTPIVLPR